MVCPSPQSHAISADAEQSSLWVRAHWVQTCDVLPTWAWYYVSSPAHQSDAQRSYSFSQISSSNLYSNEKGQQTQVTLISNEKGQQTQVTHQRSAGSPSCLSLCTEKNINFKYRCLKSNWTFCWSICTTPPCGPDLLVPRVSCGVWEKRLCLWIKLVSAGRFKWPWPREVCVFRVSVLSDKYEALSTSDARCMLTWHANLNSTDLNTGQMPCAVHKCLSWYLHAARIRSGKSLVFPIVWWVGLWELTSLEGVGLFCIESRILCWS